MQKGTKVQQEASSSLIPQTSSEAGGGETQMATEGIKDRAAVQTQMTVGQYLKQSPQKTGINELVCSLFAKKTMSFNEWESTVKKLITKKVR